MMALPDFLLKANIVFTAMFAVYYFLLRREKFLVGNRFLLLASFQLSVIIPLCPSLVLTGIKSSGISIANTLLGTTSGIGSAATAVNQFESIMPYSIYISTYLMVVIFLLTRLVLQVLKIFRIVNTSSKREINGVFYYEPTQELPPFSFFRYIVITHKTLNSEQFRNILVHESCHCQQLHSIDILFTELACIVFWFNPLIYVYRSQVKLNLEFLADKQVLCSGADRKAYQRSLVSIATKNPLFNLANSFRSSKIKQRIMMMNTGLSNSNRPFKYAAIVPLVIMLYVLVNIEQTITGMTSKIFIDARTERVKFTLGPAANQSESGFKGIYVVKGKVYTDQQIRDLLRRNGQLEFVFNDLPILGFYTPNDATAIRKWGKTARNGAIFLEAKNVLR